VPVSGTFVEGALEIIDNPKGERMRLTAARLADAANVSVLIKRPQSDETLSLYAQAGERGVLISAEAPAEPHAFEARLVLRVEGKEEVLPFRMIEPEGHHQ